MIWMLGRVAHKVRCTNGEAKQQVALVFAVVAMACMFTATPSEAQNYRFGSVKVDGNERVDASTILSYAGIARGQTVSAAQLNEAYQRIVASGLFESVSIEPRGSTLVISVAEYPTINRISFEGNRRIKDKDLEPAIRSQSRRVFNPTVVEADANTIVEAYVAQGRLSARVTPKVIRRSNNRVDLVFEILEGSVVEIERIGIVGNSAYSDRRLRRVLQTKQAGILRSVIGSDTFVADRIEFDKQVLRDFYLSRGYVDFRTTAVNAELAEERDGYFVTFNVQEGQPFNVGTLTVTSDLPTVDTDLFLAAVKTKEGSTYSPAKIERDISRLEATALRQGLDFIRVEPRISRNDRDLTLDVEYVVSKGPRIFVERIDIEGNATTLDRVIRRQFKVAEGDPFNPREIRESAERIRALGYFANADVNAREGSSPDQVVVDVDVQEQNTGSLSFGGTYSSSNGFGLNIKFAETNFLGRGQKLDLSVTTGVDNRQYLFSFSEPAFLGRNVEFGLGLSYLETNDQIGNYDTAIGRFQPSLSFPVSDNGSLSVRYTALQSEITNATAGGVITAEAAQGKVLNSSLGYTYTFDSRRTGLNPNAGFRLEFGQDFGGLGTTNRFIKTTAKAVAQTLVLNEEVTLRATLEGGMLNYQQGNSRIVDRFFMGPEVMRGFAPGGIGPRENDGGTINDALGGNMFAVARFEAEFPVGLPEEYGISGGVFMDVGSVWNVGNTSAATGSILYDDFSTRSVVGVSLFWDTPVGPLRFNFSKPISKRAFDKEQNFNLTLSTTF